MDYSTVVFLLAMYHWRSTLFDSFLAASKRRPHCTLTFKQFALFVRWMMPEMLQKFLRTAQLFSNVSMLVYPNRWFWCTVGLIGQPKFRSFVDLSYTAHLWLLLWVHALLLLNSIHFHLEHSQRPGASFTWLTQLEAPMFTPLSARLGHVTDAPGRWLCCWWKWMEFTRCWT